VSTTFATAVRRDAELEEAHMLNPGPDMAFVIAEVPLTRLVEFAAVGIAVERAMVIYITEGAALTASNVPNIISFTLAVVVVTDRYFISVFVDAVKVTPGFE